MGIFKARRDDEGYDDGVWDVPEASVEDIADNDYIDDTPATPADRDEYPSMDIDAKVSLELKVARPEQFSDAQDIANNLLDGRTVIMNTDFVNKDHEKRIEDFLLGVVYAIRGNIRRVAANTLIITPNNVSVSDQENTKADVAVAADDVTDDLAFDHI